MQPCHILMVDTLMYLILGKMQLRVEYFLFPLCKVYSFSCLLFCQSLFAAKRLVFTSSSWIAKMYPSIFEDNGAFWAIFWCCFGLHWRYFSWNSVANHVGLYISIHKEVFFDLAFYSNINQFCVIFSFLNSFLEFDRKVVN